MTIRSAETSAPALHPVVREGRARGARAKLVRAAAHVAVWSPFPISVADSLGGGWHPVGDGALIGLASWLTFSRRISLVGQGTVLPGNPHDLGPAEFWLLAIPVRLDPERGLVWGAALLCMVAASIAIEAAWSVRGEIGGLLASGVILAIIAWMPAIPVRPYWNPFFGAMWFLAALATAWAVMSGHRKWWPVLVVCASLAAQAHLMFALASVGLVLVALIVTLADGLKASTGRGWLITGLVVGEACWLAPLDQQFLFPPGNMSALIQAETSGRPAGPAFALRALSAFTEPPALWWQRHLGVRPDIYRLIEARPAGFAVAVLCVTALVLPLAVFKLRSRWLASLATISLVADAAAVIAFSGIPSSDLGRLNYLVLVMFPVGLLAWLTVGSAVLLTGRQLISSRQARIAKRPETLVAQLGTIRSAWSRLATYSTCAAAAALIALASLHDLAQASRYPGAGLNSDQVGVADRLIERALPARRVFALSVDSNTQGERYRVSMGLLFALTVQGHDPDASRFGPVPPIPRVVVLIKGNKVTVKVTPGPRRLIRSGHRRRTRR